MIVQVTFEFLQGLNNDNITLVPNCFEELGEEYVQTVEFYCENKRILCMDTNPYTQELMQESMTEEMKAKQANVGDFTTTKVPLYLAKKDFANWVQSVYPLARVEVLNGMLN